MDVPTAAQLSLQCDNTCINDVSRIFTCGNARFTPASGTADRGERYNERLRIGPMHAQWDITSGSTVSPSERCADRESSTIVCCVEHDARSASHQRPLSEAERPLERQTHGGSQGPQMADCRLPPSAEPDPRLSLSSRCRDDSFMGATVGRSTDLLAIQVILTSDRRPPIAVLTTVRPSG